MKHPLAVLAVALGAAFAGHHAMAADPTPISKAEYKTGEDRIDAEYKVNKQKCAGLSGNTKDICKAEAEGIEKVAKAELEYRYKPSVNHAYEIREARADAQYEIAKEKCDDRAGNAKDVCQKEAKAAHVTAIADAKVARTDLETAMLRGDRLAAAEKTATGDKLAAEFSVAKERCDALAGNAKDACIADAKARLGIR